MRNCLPLTNDRPVISLAASPDGKWLAVGQTGRNEITLTIWDTETWGCAASVEGDGVCSLSFNRHSDTLAYTDGQYGINMFDLKTMSTGDFLSVDRPRKISYARSKDLLLVCGQAVTVWGLPEISGSFNTMNEDYTVDPDTGEVTFTNYQHPEPLFRYDDYRGFEQTGLLSPEILENYYVLPKWINTGERRSNGHAGAVFCQQDNSILITGNYQPVFSRYDLASGQLAQQYPGGLLQTAEIMTDPAEEYLFVISTAPRTNLLWHLPTMERALPDVLHDRRYGAKLACLHPSGRFLATSNPFGPIRILDIGNGKFLPKEGPRNTNINVMTFSGDGRQLITADYGSLVLTDIEEYL